MEKNLFIREFELSSISNTLNFYQKIVGDVSCVVWDASIVLAKYLEKKFSESNNFLKNNKVIELGAGLGCVGITASCLGAHVVSSDLPNCIPLLDLNIIKNKNIWSQYGKIKSVSLVWGEDTKFDFVPDKILLADCVYYEESINPLIKTLVNLAGLNTEILVSQELRETIKQQKCWEIFMERLNEHFKVSVIPLSQQSDEFCSPDIILLKVHKY